MSPLFRGIAIGAVLVALALAPFLTKRAYVARAAETAPSAATVTIDNFSFTPKEIAIAKGTTVTWVNHDDVPHTVVSPEKAFRSKALDTDDKFSFTFNDAGTYNYFCSVHPMMTGRVVVK